MKIAYSERWLVFTGSHNYAIYIREKKRRKKKKNGQEQGGAREVPTSVRTN